MAEKIEIDQIEDGLAKIDGSNIPPTTHWTNLHAGGLDSYIFHGTDVGSNFQSVLVIDSGTIFRTNKTGMQSWLGIADVGNHKSKTIPLTQAYRRCVIPLCVLDNTNISLESYFFGNVYAKRNNNLGPRMAGVAIEVGKIYNENNPAVNITYSDSDSTTYFKPVTFIYGGLKYFGLEIGAATASFTYAIVDGMSDEWSYINAVDFYNTQNSTIINAEINNSIADYVFVNDIHNKVKISLFKHRAEAFIKNGGNNTNVLLDGGNVKPISDFQNNYLDTILTTNGTTTGTIYTFKRVGLSDLILTLTAASASFSGVVTTGAQTFEGVKAFLKSPKVPNAVNADEAVNKAQMDATVTKSLRVDGNGIITTNVMTTDVDNIRNAAMYAQTGSANRPNNQNSTVVNYTVNQNGTLHYGFDLGVEAFSNRFWFRREQAGVKLPWVEFYHTGNFNPAQYVMISALNTTLAGYATLAGTQTFTGQNTFSQAPIVPNGTLNGHAVNLGQLNMLLSGYAPASAIPTNNNQLANGAGYITATALGGYVLQTSLTSQLANYVTANAVQNITATKTFTVSPIVPNGTLAGHTVNLGQLTTLLNGKVDKTTSITINGITQDLSTNRTFTIALPGGQLTVNTTSDLVGGFVYLPNGNITTTLGLSTSVLNALADGVMAYSYGDHNAAGYIKSSFFNSTAYQHIKFPNNGQNITIGDYRKTVISIFNSGTTNITIQSSASDGAELEIRGRTVAGTGLNVNINHLDINNNPANSISLESGGRAKFYFSKAAGTWERIF